MRSCWLLVLGFSLFSSVSVAAEARHTGDGGERVHTVEAGQTLAKIAKRYGVTVEELEEANHLRRGQKVREGAKVVIPGGVARDRDPGGHGGRGDGARKDADRDVDDADGAAAAKGKKKGAVARGHLRLVQDGVVWEGKAVDDRGRATRAARDAFVRLLSSGKKRHGVSAELIGRVVEISDHFGGKAIEIVRSTPVTDKPPKGSGHARGRAIDLRVTGVPAVKVRDFCKTLTKTGCGYYPSGTFVHVDARDQAFAWVDLAKPGAPPRYEDADQAKHAEPHGSPADPKVESKKTSKTRAATN